MKKSSKPNEASSSLNRHRGRTIPVAALLILVVLISAGSGVYAGASYFVQQAPNVTVTTTLFTTTTSWTTSTIWSTVTEVVQGVLTTVQYTTSTSTVTVTGGTNTGTFGTTSNAGATNGGGGTAGYIVATKYTLSQAGTVTQVSIYVIQSGNVKAAIYADNSGRPGNLLAANNAPTAVRPGWTTISIGPVSMAAGTYWIAFNQDVSSIRVYKAGGTRQSAYVPYAFSNNMPTNWTPYTYQNLDYVCYATYIY